MGMLCMGHHYNSDKTGEERNRPTTFPQFLKDVIVYHSPVLVGSIELLTQDFFRHVSSCADKYSPSMIQVVCARLARR